MLNNLLSLGEPIVLAHIGGKGLCDQPPMKTLKMSCLMGFPGQEPHTRVAASSWGRMCRVALVGGESTAHRKSAGGSLQTLLSSSYDL